MKCEKALRTRRSQACNSSTTLRPLFANDELSSGHCGATSVLKLSGVRLSTVSLPVERPHFRAPPASILDGRPGRQTATSVVDLKFLRPCSKRRIGTSKSKNHTRVVSLLVSLDSEVRTRLRCRSLRTSESGHECHISLNR